jgi:aerotaxis receptor
MASIARVTSLLEHINTAALEQSAGVGQVNGSVTQLDGITQQNAAMVEQLAAAAVSLTDQVSVVHNTIRVFLVAENDATLAEANAVQLRKQSRQAGGKLLSFSPA